MTKIKLPRSWNIFIKQKQLQYFNLRHRFRMRKEHKYEQRIFRAADKLAESNGHNYYVIRNYDGKLLILSNSQCKELKRKKIIRENVYLLRDAIYIANASSLQKNR